MTRFQTVDFEKIKKGVEEAEIVVKERLEVAEEKMDKVEIALSDIARMAKDHGEEMELLRRIADKEYPAFPRFPAFPKTEFPRIQRVEVINHQETDFTELKNLLSKIVSLLSEPRPQLQPIIVQAPELKEPANEGTGDVARASPIGVRTRAKSRLVPEIPTGTINGTNKTFFLSRAPRYNTQIFLFLNSAYQTPGGNDYTITGNQITYVNAPASGSSHYVLIFQS